MRLLRVGVSPVSEHHALYAGCWGIFAVLKEHRRVIRSSLNRKVPVLLLHLVQVLFDSLFCNFFLSVHNLADIRSPDCQAEGHNKVEESDVTDEPPVERWHLSAAGIVDAAPELQLAEEEAPADEKVEAKE